MALSLLPYSTSRKIRTDFEVRELIWVPLEPLSNYSYFRVLPIMKLTGDVMTNLALALGFGFGFHEVLVALKKRRRDQDVRFPISVIFLTIPVALSAFPESS